MTPWGYDVSEALTPILSVSDFNIITDYAYEANPRVKAALDAASQAVRNYCGWHICPSLTCTAYPPGGSNILKLPARYVSGVTSITEDGESITDYDWRRDGLIRRKYPWKDSWNISVTYQAGYDADAVPELIESVVSIASGVLAVSAGVISESADGVSISYSSSASSIAASLTSNQKAALDIYKVVNAYAT